MSVVDGMMRVMSKYEASVLSLKGDRDRAMELPTEEKLLSIRRLLGGRPLIAVGSGGTLAVAEIAAYMHRVASGQYALAVTPLGLVQSPAPPEDTLVIMFSARAKHPDTALAADHAISRGLEVVLVTERLISELSPAFANPRVHVLTIAPGEARDGFLATGSVIRMAATVARIYGFSVPAVRHPRVPTMTDRLLVLHGAEGAAAARDIETRMHELGLATVQLADYRNVAHGRHVGMQRHLAETTVVALLGEDSEALAGRTLGAFPSETRVVRLDSALSGPSAAIDLLFAAMNLPLSLAGAASLEPSKPRVPAFGRKLYHLPYKRVVRPQAISPVGLKIRAAGASLENELAVAYYSRSYAAWRAKVRRADFVGVVLDYDGTCVETRERWSLPTEAVREQLLRLMTGGVRVAFASGRGDSLYSDLRGWVPPGLRSQVLLGLHNGTWQQELALPLSEPPSAHSDTLDASDRLDVLEEVNLARVRRRGNQIAVTPASVTQSISTLRDLVETTLTGDLRSALKVLSSAHSVDVFPREAGKQNILKLLQNGSGEFLVIGDQGGIDGNDFDLLHATPFSISVDRISADPSRCWPVFSPSVKGPEALIRILRAVELRRNSLRYSPPTLKASQ